MKNIELPKDLSLAWRIGDGFTPKAGGKFNEGEIG